MPNESSGKDLQIMCWSLLRQISPSWRNWHHKVSTSVKLFLFILFFFFSFFLLFSPGHDLFTISNQLAVRFERNFTCILMGSVHIAVQNFIDLMIDLDLSRSQLYKMTVWAISRFLLDKLLPNLTHGDLGRGFSINQKHLERFEHDTYANALRWQPLYKKTSLTKTFKVRHLG